LGLSELARNGTGAYLQWVAFTVRTYKRIFHVRSAAHILDCGVSGTEVVQSVAKLAPKSPNDTKLEKTKTHSELSDLASSFVELRD
jgi:hypothetical protein